ncbi:NAD-dependent 4,6-dehydratase LegB [Leptospira sp. 96542]|nr:NAD-dependent 4,6-dehydratase LegB [Leptospira sp. 96542]
MKKILVTGADGFIGSHLTETLVRLGYDVKAFVYYNSFNSWGWLDHCANDVKGKFEVFVGDIRDPNGVRSAMKGMDAVFHLAALIGIPFSYHSPDTYVDTNIKGTLNILQAARDFNLSKVIHTSTSEVYGTAQFVPITEEHPVRGQSPYSASKIGADQIAYSFYTSFQTPVITIRPFNTYGPRQSARAIIPTIITQILGGKKEIQLGSTSPTRDFNYVEDTVRGFLSALKATNGIGDVVNIGNGFEVKMGDTANYISEIIGTPITIKTDELRLRPGKSEVERLWASNEKAKQLFGWEPEYKGLEGFKLGLKKTVEWFKDPENRKSYKADIYNV